MYSEVVSAEDLDIAARTVWGEARGESFAGKLAVAHVICNRAVTNYMGDTLAAVCKKPKQFSCWNSDDPNREKMESLGKDDPAYQDCLTAVSLALVSDEDPVDGARHYYSKAINAPYWAADATRTFNIGNHIFLKGIR